ncbi:MAG TPA: hypothetical protein VEX70_07240 [Pyrinomonadaceae bacterium]|jgi:hypothetical protein|nr:hypothetical protein [Pyrinomonadaceae bacterium]
MSAKPNVDAADDSRRKIFIIAGVVSALLIALLVFWATRSDSGGPVQQPRLAGAIRADAPEFAGVRERLIVDFNPDDHALVSTRAIGDEVINMMPKVRNFTGRTLNGLELQATVVDLAGNPIQQRTVIAIPNRQPELEPNKVLEVPIRMEGFRKDDGRANIHIEVTGVKFK